MIITHCNLGEQNKEVLMVNEVLYMEMRLLQQFCTKCNISSIEANKLFKKYGVWNYIEECYSTLHLNGDEYILNDINQIMTAKGVAL